jgi:hypothetical protein
VEVERFTIAAVGSLQPRLISLLPAVVANLGTGWERLVFNENGAQDLAVGLLCQPPMVLRQPDDDRLTAAR